MNTYNVKFPILCVYKCFFLNYEDAKKKINSKCLARTKPQALSPITLTMLSKEFSSFIFNYRLVTY